MGIEVAYHPEGNAAFLYDNTSMRPINTEAFSDEEQAEHFLQWFLKRFDRSNIYDSALVDEAREDWAAECLDADGELTYGDS